MLSLHYALPFLLLGAVLLLDHDIARAGRQSATDTAQDRRHRHLAVQRNDARRRDLAQHGGRLAHHLDNLDVDDRIAEKAALLHLLADLVGRSEEHTSALQSLMSISSAVF